MTGQNAVHQQLWVSHKQSHCQQAKLSSRACDCDYGTYPSTLTRGNALSNLQGLQQWQRLGTAVQQVLQAVIAQLHHQSPLQLSAASTLRGRLNSHALKVYDVGVLQAVQQ